MAAIARLRRTLATLAFAGLAFLVYHVSAVPLIEPEFKDQTVIELPPPPVDPLQSKNFDAFFPPGAWELDKPIVLESDRSKLLFKEYKNLDNGRVQLYPCAIMFFPNGETAGDVPPRVIVLEAPQGALLQFDGPVDLDRWKLGQLQSGQMDGPITIHGTPSRPGANDELFADTRDLKMTPELISTEAPVNIRFGPNEGHGRQLEIRLAPSNKPAGKQRGPNIGAIQSLAVLHDVEMRFVPGKGGMLPLDGRPDQAKTAAASNRGPPEAANRIGPQPIADFPAQPSAGSPQGGNVGAATQNAVPQPPVNVRCQGPFKFDVVTSVATFQDDVKAIRVPREGPTDRMFCDWLAITFGQKRMPPNSPVQKPNPSGDQSGDVGGPAKKPGLEPQRIEARGRPVLVRGDSSGAYIRAEHLTYDIITGRIVVEDPQEAALRQYASEIHARSVDYEPGEAGRLGRLTAIGPGWLRTAQQSDGKAGIVRAAIQQAPAANVTQLGLPVAPSHQSRTGGQVFEAHWSGSLKMRPHEGLHVVSLVGDAKAGFTGQGELTADEIHLWLKELPPTKKPLPGEPAPRWQVFADRMLAQPSPDSRDIHLVQINSPQLSGTTSKLEAWFEQAAASAAGPSAPSAGGANSIPSAGFAATPGNTATNAAAIGFVNPFVTGPAGAPPAAGQFGMDGRPAGALPPHYHVEGERIRLQIHSAGSRSEIQNVTIDGQAQFGQMPSPRQPAPLLVAGDQIEVLRADAPDTDVTVTGKPAQFGARGLEMYAGVIHMNKASNRVWIDEPGRMRLPESSTASLAGFGPSTERPASGTGPSGQPRSVVRNQPPDPMFVTWKDKMEFDGLVARFEHSIVGESRAREFRTDVLEVSLRRRIDFAQPRGEDRAEIGRIVCRGGMWMESRSFDPLDPQKLTSIDRMQTRDLTIDETTGAILGEGPGWLTSIRRGSIDPNKSPSAGIAMNTVAKPVADSSGKPPTSHHRRGDPKAPPPAKSEFSYLNVQFTGPLSGNQNRHEITFHDHVRGVYGPVASWQDELNPDEIDNLGPGGALMTCDQLTVRQTNDKPPAGAPDRHPVELEAIGNASVEGEQFRALASRLTYAESKDLLILEGDGRRDAELYRQARPGDDAPHTTARQILYWRSTNSVSFYNPRYGDFNQLPGRDPPPKTPK